MNTDELVEAALQELMAENDGVRPNSCIPVEQQLAAKRAEYLKILELKPFKARIQLAMDLIHNQIHAHIKQDQFDLLLLELSFAADILVENPEKQGDELGISQQTLDLLFDFAQNCLREGKYTDAAAILTLCTVLDRSRFSYWFFLGVSLQELKEYHEAIKAYEMANEITELEPLTHLFLAECYCDVSDKQKAEFFLDKAKVIMKGLPQNPDWDQAVARIQSKIK